jgi:hypothetical protein
MNRSRRSIRLWIAVTSLWLAAVGFECAHRWPASLPVVPAPSTVKGPVTPAEIEAFRLWLRAGAPSRIRINEHIRDYATYAFLPPLVLLALGAIAVAIVNGIAGTSPNGIDAETARTKG